jgi:hypothetical protein
MNSCSHSTIRKAASSQFFFGREKRRRIEVSCRLSRQRIRLRTDAERSTAARESYTRIKKDQSRDTDVRARNTTPKAVADRMPERGQIDAQRYANRTRARIGTSTQTRLYLALNWQRAQIGLPHTSGDRRFPTPQPTTNHLLLQLQPGTTGALLLFRNRIQTLPAIRAPRQSRGAGGSAGCSRRERNIDKLTRNFPRKCLPYSVLMRSKKRRPTRLDAQSIPFSNQHPKIPR